MSPFWLFLIIPISFMAGYVVCGTVSTNSELERCEKCIYENKDDKKETD